MTRIEPIAYAQHRSPLCYTQYIAKSDQSVEVARLLDGRLYYHYEKDWQVLPQVVLSQFKCDI